MRNPSEIIVNGKSLRNILDDHNLWLSEPADNETHSRANLISADLISADLISANLRSANLSGADLSGAQGIKTAKEYLSQFKRTADGIVVCKGIGHTQYPSPSHWKIEPGAFLEEVVNPDRSTDCGCGVNFGTKEWIKRNYPDSTIWECLIWNEDASDVVVPFNTDGKARCGRLQLLRIDD